MSPATPESVRGDFADARFEHMRVVSTFTTRDGQYVVSTEGQDGVIREYQVSHTFGVDPLQQYLVEFPGDGEGAASRKPVVEVRPTLAERLLPRADTGWRGGRQGTGKPVVGRARALVDP